MLPYFSWTSFNLGPLTLYVWGLFASVGLAAGALFAVREARRRSLDIEKFESLLFSVLIWAFVGARLFHVVFYGGSYYWADPWEILKIWHGGWSSIGGFVGGAAAFLYGARKRGLPALKTAGPLALALPLGLGCGRIGCFLIHDHPGTLSHSLLAVNYPGGARFDLGMLLGIFDFLLFGLFLWLMRKPRPEGFFLALLMTVYGPVRFGLDFLRASDLAGSDPRFFGLTAAQYFCASLTALGICMFISSSRKRESGTI